MPGDARATDGLLLSDKPTGPTSHDMVAAVRRTLGALKVGHAGTLDPLASGLMVIMVGRATKLAPFIPGDPKVYEGSMLLGLSTDSMDIDGMVVSEGTYEDGPERLGATLSSLEGEMEQLPPMYSAVKYRGEALYHYARRGEVVPRKSRTVRVYRVDMADFRETGPRPECDFMISCSPGFYVREFVSRVGEMLGCGATLSRLRRISSGPFHVKEALGMDELLSRCAKGGLQLLPITRALSGIKRVMVREEEEKAAGNGAVLSEEMIGDKDEGIEEGDIVVVMAHDLEVIGLHDVVSVSPFVSRPRRIL